MPIDPHIAQNYEERIAELEAHDLDGVAYLRDMATKEGYTALLEWLDQRAPKVEDATAGPEEKAVRKGK